MRKRLEHKNVVVKRSDFGLTMRMNGDQERRAETLVAVLSGLGSARLSWRVMRGVKRTHKAAPPHHAVAPDSAEGRSQVNRVVRLRIGCVRNHQIFKILTRLKNKIDTTSFSPNIRYKICCLMSS
mgnify:CR=1 FL=1